MGLWRLSSRVLGWFRVDLVGMEVGNEVAWASQNMLNGLTGERTVVAWYIIGWQVLWVMDISGRAVGKTVYI